MAPNIIIGKLWEGLWSPGIYVISTTSSIVTNKANNTEHLLIGIEPNALIAKQRYPNLDVLGAKAIREVQQKDRTGAEYGFALAVPPQDDAPGLGLFQSKNWVENPNDLFVIGMAASRLLGWCVNNPDVYVRMEFPGDVRMRKQVLTLLSVLPPQVTVCRPD